MTNTDAPVVTVPVCIETDPEIRQHRAAVATVVAWYRILVRLAGGLVLLVVQAVAMPVMFLGPPGLVLALVLYWKVTPR